MFFFTWILKVRGASQRKSLQGLDNTAVSGAESFNTLTKVVSDLEECGVRHEWCEETQNDLKAGERYSKTRYRAQCRDDSDESPHHCRQHALRNIECAEFQAACHHEHLEVCPDCERLEATMESILTQVRESKDVQFYSQDHKEDLRYDAAQAQEMVLQWKAHILRAENQDQASGDGRRTFRSRRYGIHTNGLGYDIHKDAISREKIGVVWKAQYELAHSAASCPNQPLEII